jgi:acyl-coenzyme A thioesterase PaaI-like protein
MTIRDEDKDLVGYLEKAIGIIDKMEMRILAFRPRSVKIMLPKEPNMNHIGSVYAGSLFSLVDFAGGVLFYASFDYKRYYPILKEVTITFKIPATTDITVEASMTSEQVKRMEKVADEAGKADWLMNLELRDEKGSVCCIAHGNFQMRKV